MRVLSFLLALALAGSGALRAETLPSPLAAGAADPVFTTYAAPLARSEYLVDEGWHLRFDDSSQPLALSSDTAGEWGIGFELDGVVLYRVGDYDRLPVVRQSYASLARFDFAPFHGLSIDATFAAYSSRESLLALRLANENRRPRTLRVFAFALAPESGFGVASIPPATDGLLFGHREPRDAWSESPPPEYENEFLDLLLLSRGASSFGGYRGGEEAMLADLGRGLVSGDLSFPPRALLLVSELAMSPGESSELRIVRAVSPVSAGSEPILARSRALLSVSPSALEREEAEVLARAPHAALERDDELVYRGALSLARQSMLPPEGRTEHNYYVFSREPTWSWGHDGQVFHESLSMLAYAFLDPESAMDSQRVFMEAQEKDGYIPYRVGPYVVRTFPVDGEKTTSAPFYSWVNEEVYRAAKGRVDDATARAFLEDAYRSGSAFVEFLVSHRDRDHDGLLEWGGHAVLESVRDSLVPIWKLLGGNDPKAPSRVEALDLNAMVVMEMRSLAGMARELGRSDEGARWEDRATGLSRLVERTMWDEETGFYYNVDRDTNRFVTGDGLDLRREEIIGFLPLWAGIASREHAEALVSKLTDPKKFWRRFGVPTLSADDPGYEPLVKRCCQWNGAVWLEWDYLVFSGLERYGYHDVARELGEKMVLAAGTQLRRNHRFWESYSPDEVKLASPRNYIWNSILARVLLDLHRSEAMR
jgi:Mannosylglycerate hydrolase MGH1-like glycoside hydrolase domain